MNRLIGSVGVVLVSGALAAPVGAQPAASESEDYTEKITVTATRLPGDTPLKDVPAHVTVIEREQIEKSGAWTLQDLLIREAGVRVHDSVGIPSAGGARLVPARTISHAVALRTSGEFGRWQHMLSDYPQVVRELVIADASSFW